MRPGPLLIRLVLAIALLAMLVPIARPLAWVAAAALFVLAGFAAADALWLRGVSLLVDRAPKVALALGEHETTMIRVATTASK
ncbi:MAG TPA: hypothetical protein VHU41_05015, partial [Thermoanaerobaculia bacterium]|nr:hypothetical protein [Thermoanaerobaculia bacterium]